ncbi:MAG: (2Fe-2S)-binding protein [Spirochaetales bacterium]|nr:(2Fe-2S)-binding protein [Spirochaetales bacterium]
MSSTLKKIKFTVNGRELELEIDIRESLLDILRDRLELTGAKRGCEVGECGACTVMVNGEPVDSCIYLGVWAEGKEIITVEGLSAKGELTAMQQSFIDEGAVQCGFCTPGLVVSATALESGHKKMSGDEIKRELSGHLCRCTGYKQISTAVDKVINKKEP